MKSTLHSKKVVVTRAIDAAGEFIAGLERAGATVVHIPTISIVAPSSWHDLDSAIERLDLYDWVVFTSSNSVRYFMGRLEEQGYKLVIMGRRNIAAVGDQTRALLQAKGVVVRLVPEEFSSLGLLDAFGRMNVSGQRFLLPKVENGPDSLRLGLVGMGALADEVIVYRNLPVNTESNTRRLGRVNGQVDWLTFTSPSTFHNFVALTGREKMMSWVRSGCRIAAISGVTAKSIIETRFRVDLVPVKATLPALIDAMQNFQDHR